MKLKFKTTDKKSREYKYRESVWDLTKQLSVDEYLKTCKYPFVKGGWVEEKVESTCGYKICVNDEWKDKAGGYAIQGIASKFVKRINGNYDNVVGLSLVDADKMLKGIRP